MAVLSYLALLFNFEVHAWARWYSGYDLNELFWLFCNATVLYKACIYTGWSKKTEPSVFHIVLLFLYISEQLFDTMMFNSCHTPYISRHSSTMPWTAKEKAFCVKWYFATNVYNSVRKQFQKSIKNILHYQKENSCMNYKVCWAWNNPWTQERDFQQDKGKITCSTSSQQHDGLFRQAHPSQRGGTHIELILKIVIKSVVLVVSSNNFGKCYHSYSAWC